MSTLKARGRSLVYMKVRYAVTDSHTDQKSTFVTSAKKTLPAITFNFIGLPYRLGGSTHRGVHVRRPTCVHVTYVVSETTEIADAFDLHLEV